jgi:cellulose synthase/poly-beta-1,6-N-acetylglucosamine synthase-like glycosyltransferase
MVEAMLLFWGTLATFVFAYAGFPLLLAVVARWKPRPVRKREVTPRVSVVIAAHNEAGSLAQRIENILASDYPPDQLEIVVASDGSTDNGPAIAEAYASRGVRVLRLPRVGKLRALDAGILAATGELLVLSDANALFEPDALRRLAANFADPDVGGVVGHTMYRVASGSHGGSLGERLYWRYDTWLKQLESRTGSVVSAHGGFYALRRELYRFESEAAAATDDFAISTAVVAAGRRLVYERDARAYEFAVTNAGREFRRRVRLMTRGLRGVALRRALLNPRRFGFYAVILFCHKVLRRVLVLGLPVLFASALWLAPRAGLYAMAAAMQVLFYSLAGLGWLVRGTRLGRRKWLYVPFHYCATHAAAAVALFNFARGQRIESWQPQRHPSA